MVAEIIILNSKDDFAKPYDYLVPNHDIDIIKVGMRVSVSFGNRKNTIGFVVKLKENSLLEELKYIDFIIDDIPLIKEIDLELAYYIKDKFYISLAKALNTLIPGVLRIKYEKKIVVLNRDKLNPILLSLLKNKTNIYTKNLLKHNNLIKKEEIDNNIKIISSLKKENISKEIIYIYQKELNVKSDSQKALIDLFKEKQTLTRKEILDLGYNESLINSLIKKGIIKKDYNEVLIKPNILDLNKYIPTPNERQLKIINNIDLSKYSTNLIYGVTGSGKTLIYLKLVEKVINNNKDVIILVPEIAITTELLNYFKQIFNDDISIIHSKLTNKERLSTYLKILRGDVRIVLGPRSALFAPFKNLGLIIIDEEHSDSYISNNIPCYDVRDLALIMAKKLNIPLVLGSATPRVTTYYKALNNEYNLYTLPFRATNNELPKISVVDMREELKNNNKSIFSNLLFSKLKSTLAKGEQAIIFLNKRGYASSVMCRDCGEIIKCPHCDLPLTYHQYNNKLMCHICGYTKEYIKICPKCKSKRIKYVGIGTEKIINEISKYFPNYKILKVDSDSVGNDFNEIYLKIINHEYDIIVGTQMIAKGLDFPLVTLVGVINADMGLFYPTYDAYEKNFQMLEQVSGRAGRHSEGEVVFQTYNPNNSTIIYSQNHDYLGFYNDEIKKRKLLDNPPFKSLLKINLSYNDKDILFENALKLSDLFKENIMTIGPSESVVFKIDENYSYDIYLKYDDFKDLNLDYRLDKVARGIKIKVEDL